jgi:uncharacterized protein YodC (DUF2158 family)
MLRVAAWSPQEQNVSDIKEGDTVRLKSGGPIMTVMFLTAGAYAKETDPKDKANCKWFPDNAKKPESETFPLSALEYVD